MWSSPRSRIPSKIRLERWTPEDLTLLRRLNEPPMTKHLGGPETDEPLANRLQRYVDATTPKSRMFKIVLARDGSMVGSTGYWERLWREATVYEAGWAVLPEHQGRGIAGEAVQAVIEIARAARAHRHLEAFPSIGNGASNAICRKLSFELVGECDFEYPPGHFMRCNERKLELWAGDEERSPSG